MQGVILDSDSLGQDIDLDPITSTLDSWSVYPSTLPLETAQRIRGCDVVLSNKIAITREMIAAGDIRFISVMATGTNNVDLAATSEYGIAVSNAVGYATPSVVQHTMALILNLATSMPRYLNDVSAGAWQESNVFCRLDHPIIELSGKTLGVVGRGTLGQGVAKVAEAFGLNVIYSARVGEAKPNDPGMPFEDLLAVADILSLHCPLTTQNHHMMDAETLNLMKPGALLVNTARGALIDPAALLSALSEGPLAAAAIDVLDGEPPGINEQLTSSQHPRLLITPHNAWGAIESRRRLVQQMRSNILGWQDGQHINPVNL